MIFKKRCLKYKFVLNALNICSLHTNSFNFLCNLPLKVFESELKQKVKFFELSYLTLSFNVILGLNLSLGSKIRPKFLKYFSFCR